ncbi:MAG: hypothetical protein K9L88_18295, partial [Chromatiaceae bacterium]|nr:hypothetical protein [Chromatiaceae bacterium]
MPARSTLSHWRFRSVGFLLVAFSAVGQTFVLSLFGEEWRVWGRLEVRIRRTLVFRAVQERGDP